jgi:hypothetical protein
MMSDLREAVLRAIGAIEVIRLGVVTAEAYTSLYEAQEDLRVAAGVLRLADLNFSNQDRKVVLTPDVNGVSPDAVSGPERKRPDNTAHSSDCCSGFVTQEGRDIHQALEHLPDARSVEGDK